MNQVQLHRGKRNSNERRGKHMTCGRSASTEDSCLYFHPVDTLFLGSIKLDQSILDLALFSLGLHFEKSDIFKMLPNNSQIF